MSDVARRTRITVIALVIGVTVIAVIALIATAPWPLAVCAESGPS